MNRDYKGLLLRWECQQSSSGPAERIVRVAQALRAGRIVRVADDYDTAMPLLTGAIDNDNVI